MPHPNPALDRTGQPQSYKTSVAGRLNWLRRCIMGAYTGLKVHTNFLWIRAHPEYFTSLTMEQREALVHLEFKVNAARYAMEEVMEAVERYHKAPKIPQPKRERQKALKTAQNVSNEVEKTEVA
jgi:hypothetical protein